MLLVVPDAHIDAVALQAVRQLAEVRLAVMVGEQHLWTDAPRCQHNLLRSHGVGLVAWQEGHINVFDAVHFRYVLSVTGNVDAQPSDGEDIAVVAPFGMELQMPLRGVVGRHRLNRQPAADLSAPAVYHNRPVAEFGGTVLVDEKLRPIFGQGCDGGRVKVVEMLVGDENHIRLGKLAVVDGAASGIAHRVNLDFLPVVFDAYAGMGQRMDFHGFAVRRDKTVGLEAEIVRFRFKIIRFRTVGRCVPMAAGGHEAEKNWYGDGFHDGIIICFFLFPKHATQQKLVWNYALVGVLLKM